MRVLIDGSGLGVNDGTGVATYTHSVSRVVRDLGHDVQLLCGRQVSDRASDLMREVRFFELPKSRRWGRPRDLAADLRRGALTAVRPGGARAVALQAHAVIRDHERSPLPVHERLWNGNRLFDTAREWHRLTNRATTLSNREIKADLAHWSFPLPLRLDGVPNVYCVHDLIPLRLPDTSNANKPQFLKILEFLKRSADLILTVSEVSRQDLIELLGVDEDRVVNTYQCVALPETGFTATHEDLVTLLKEVYGLDAGGYVLTFGSVEPRKNLSRLIEAHLASGLDMPLVHCGPDGWLAKRELNMLNRGVTHGQQRRVIRLGYVSALQLTDLIRGAACVAYPSRYEGFGLPIVEGFRCRTPVLTSGISAMAEVAGDAAHLVDPYSVQDIRDGLRKVCGDLDYADTLIERGTARLEMFSPEACARRLAAAYARLGLGGAAEVHQ